MAILIPIDTIDLHAAVTSFELKPVEVFILLALGGVNTIIIIDRVNLISGRDPDCLAPQLLHLRLCAAVILFGGGTVTTLRLVKLLVGVWLLQLSNDILLGVG